MEKISHPLEQMSSQIEEHGLMLFESVTHLPIYEKPYTSPFVVICLNHRGWLKANYDMKPVEFHPHDLIMVPPGRVLLAQKTSDDYLTSLLVISPRFIEKLSHNHLMSIEQIEFQYNSAFHLNDDQYEAIKGHFKLLHAISQVNHPKRDELLAKQMETGTQLVGIYLQEQGIVSQQQFYSTQLLSSRFKILVTKHFRESREVQYYANLLCLSPKYFGSVIKQQTGWSAAEIISRYVVIQAKSLLLNRPDLNIQQIGSQLGFADPAAFTRYFKSNAGLSPKDYREQFC